MAIGREPDVNLVLAMENKENNHLPVFPTEPWTLVAIICHTNYPPQNNLLVNHEAGALSKWLSEQIPETT